MLKHAGTYEIMTPESVGLSRSTLVMGKHSGRHAFRTKLKELGFDLGDNALEDAFRRFKELADKKKDVYDEDIIALVDDEVVRSNDRIRFVSLQVIAGSKGPQQADLELEIDGKPVAARAMGDGPVDALFKCIDRITGIEVTLRDYRVRSITTGEDAQGEAQVEVEYQGKVLSGRGVSTDILEASAQAYLQIVNRIALRQSLDERIRPTDAPPREEPALAPAAGS